MNILSTLTSISASLSNYALAAGASLYSEISENHQTALVTAVGIGALTSLGLAYNVPEKAQFMFDLFKWWNSAPPGENRAEASKRILDAYINRSTNLSLQYLSLSSLPKCIGSLTNLHTLHLSFNLLTTLPESIGSLTNLRVLSLSHNLLTTLPESIGSLTNLKYLHLFNNQLRTLPESIGRLTNLQDLSLYFNQLTTLPESIGSLTDLHMLHLARNLLETLPESIGRLSDLHSLFLSDNQLTTLPESIGRLTYLRNIDLSRNPNNRLNEIYQAHRITNQPHLRNYLRHENNPLTTIRAFQNEFLERIADNNLIEQTSTLLLSEEELANLSTIKNSLIVYLTKLIKTQDYLDEKPAIVLQTMAMLKSASQNEEFRDALSTLLEDASTDCSDRTALFAEGIEVTRRLMCDRMENGDLANYGLGLARLNLVDHLAQKVCNERGLGEQVEVILKFRLILKEALQLPIETNGMLYPGCAAAVTEEEISEIEVKIIEDTDTKEKVATLLCEGSFPSRQDPLAWKLSRTPILKAWQDRLERNYQKELLELTETMPDLSGKDFAFINQVEKDLIEKKRKLLNEKTIELLGHSEALEVPAEPNE